jgi:1-deoxy-D-xylulose-5-phosphate reductoisomerase
VIFFLSEVLSCQSNAELLIRQAIEFLPNAVVIGNEKFYPKVKEALHSYPVKVFAGEDSLSQIVEMEEIDLVLNALVGYSGLKPTLNAIRAGKPLHWRIQGDPCCCRRAGHETCKTIECFNPAC